jgi:phytoene/squalene synthetase
LDLLETAGRRVFGLMMSVYRAILRRIDRAPGEVLVRRVRLGRLQKLRIALRWTFLPPRAAALL